MQSKNQIGVGASLNQKPGQHLQSSVQQLEQWKKRRGAQQYSASGSSRTKTVHVACLFELEWGQEGWLDGGEKLPRKIWSIYFPKVSRQPGQCMLRLAVKEVIVPPKPIPLLLLLITADLKLYNARCFSTQVLLYNERFHQTHSSPPPGFEIGPQVLPPLVKL